MAFWEPSVATLAAFFEREFQQGHPRDNSTSNEKTYSEAPGTQAGATQGTSSSPRRDATTELDAMVKDIWTEIAGYVRDSQSGKLHEAFMTAGENLKERMSGDVAQEVFKRELIAALEALHTLRTSKVTKNCTTSEEQATINSLKRRLERMSEEANNAKEALQLAAKEKCELEYICEEHEEKRRKLCMLLSATETENKELRANVSSLANAKKELEVDVERLLAARRVVEVEMLQAQHKAEMAELVAEQESLRCKKLDEQLRKAENSSGLVHKHVRELEKVLEEMTSFLNITNSSAEQRRSHWIGGQVESMVHKSSRLLGRIGVSRSRDREERVADNRDERSGVSTPHAENANLKDAPGAWSGAKRSLHMSCNPNNENGDDNYAGLLHKITSRLHRGESRHPHEIESHEPKVDSTCDIGHNMGTASDDKRQEEDGTRSAPSKLTDLRRILSRSTHSNRQSQVRPSDAQAMEYMSKTLAALERNLESLRDVVDFKDEEVYSLNRKLHDAVQLSDAFEKGMKREFQKRLEMEEMMTARGGEFAGTAEEGGVLKKSSGDAKSSVRDKVTVRWSCRWF